MRERLRGSRSRERKSKYEQVEEGETLIFEPGDVQYIACCDCSLVHVYEFDIVDGKIQITIRRNDRSTAQLRRYHHKRRRKKT